MSRKNLKPVVASCVLGNQCYKQTVYGRHIRFSFLPGELFVMHPDLITGYALTHARSGRLVWSDYDYGDCLFKAKRKLQKNLKKQPFNKLLRVQSRLLAKQFSNFKK